MLCLFGSDAHFIHAVPSPTMAENIDLVSEDILEFKRDVFSVFKLVNKIKSIFSEAL